MAYFPNGTSGELYYAQWCERCVHEDGRHGDQGCPIWAAHLEFNYTNAEGANDVLEALIPMDAKGEFAERCKMFEESRKSWAVGDLFDEESAA